MDSQTFCTVVLITFFNCNIWNGSNSLKQPHVKYHIMTWHQRKQGWGQSEGEADTGIQVGLKVT